VPIQSKRPDENLTADSGAWPPGRSTGGQNRRALLRSGATEARLVRDAVPPYRPRMGPPRLLARLACLPSAALASCGSAPCRSPAPLPAVAPLASPAPTDGDVDAGPDVCNVAPDAATCQVGQGNAALARWYSPRCDPRDPDCGPEVVRSDQKCSPGSAKRVPIRSVGARHAFPACHSDGDCRFTPCAETCFHYQIAPAGCDHGFAQLGPSLPSTLPNPTWCGCVDRQCALFTQ
jgi:hypothetical protein